MKIIIVAAAFFTSLVLGQRFPPSFPPQPPQPPFRNQYPYCSCQLQNGPVDYPIITQNACNAFVDAQWDVEYDPQDDNYFPADACYGLGKLQVRYFADQCVQQYGRLYATGAICCRSISDCISR